MFREIILSIAFCCYALIHESSSEITKKQYGNFSVRTSYANRIPDLSVKPASCLLYHVEHVARHGVRTPSKAYLDNFIKLHAKLMECCRDKLSNELQNWEPMKEEETLKNAKTGDDEQKQIAQFYFDEADKAGFKFDEINTEFYSSGVEHATDNLKSFREYLFGRKVNDEPKVDRNSLRNYQDCKKEVKVDDPKMSEKEKFLGTVVVQNQLIGFRNRLSYQNLSFIDLDTCYKACAFGVAVSATSPWCDLLTPSDIDVLEYAEDLEHYYTLGYGNLNYKKACTLFVGIRNNINKIVNNNNSPDSTPASRGVFRFGHKEILIPFTSLLGIYYQQEPLMAEKYEESLGRKYRISKLSPFSANVDVALLKCSGKFKIGIFLNAELCFMFNQTSGSYIYDVDQFLGRFNECNDNANLCDNGANRNPLELSIWLSCVIIVILYYMI